MYSSVEEAGLVQLCRGGRACTAVSSRQGLYSCVEEGLKLRPAQGGQTSVVTQTEGRQEVATPTKCY